MRKVDILSRRRVLDDVFKVDEAELRFERFDGSLTPPVRRLVFERGDSVAAVISIRETGQLLFTEQFRFPTLEHGPGWLVEIMAGSIDLDESPEAAVRREIEEELGYGVDRLDPIATFYVSPGGSSERIWLYFVETTEARRVSAGGGVALEHEDIRVLVLSRDEARAALDTGRLADAKTIIALQWLFANAGR